MFGRRMVASQEASPSAGLGWRLGLLYGPAVYGVSAAAVALPGAAAALHTAPTETVWILSAHALALGVGTAVAGRSCDMWGPRRVMASAAALLICGLLACALAPTLPWVVAGRAVLALGSGATTATALAVAAATPIFRRPRVLAALGTTMAGISATAPMVGAVATSLSWRAALVLPALSLLVMPLIGADLKSRTVTGRLDLLGAVWLSLTVAGILLLAQSATAQMPTSVKLAILVVTAAAMTALAAHARRHPQGFVPTALLRDRRFHRAANVGAGIYAGLFAAVYAIPHLLAQSGYSPMAVGVLLLPAAALGAIGARVAASATRHLPRMRVLSVAAFSCAATVVVAGVDGRPILLVVAAAAAFAAFAAAQMILTAELSAHVDHGLRGAAVGLLNLAFFMGGALGPAVCAAMWQPIGLPNALAWAAAFPAVSAALAWKASRRHAG